MARIVALIGLIGVLGTIRKMKWRIRNEFRKLENLTSNFLFQPSLSFFFLLALFMLKLSPPKRSRLLTGVSKILPRLDMSPLEFSIKRREKNSLSTIFANKGRCERAEAATRTHPSFKGDVVLVSHFNTATSIDWVATSTVLQKSLRNHSVAIKKTPGGDLGAGLFLRECNAGLLRFLDSPFQL